MAAFSSYSKPIIALTAALCLSACAANRTIAPNGPIHTPTDSVLANPSLLAAQERVSQAQNAENIAVLNMLPDATVTGGITGYTYDSLEPDNRTAASDLSLSIDLNIIRTLASARGYSSALLTTQAEKAALSAQQATLLVEIATAIGDLERTKRILMLRKNALGNLQRYLSNQRRLLETGTISNTDLQQVRGRIAQAESNLLTANADNRAAEAKLMSLSISPNHSIELANAQSYLPSDESEIVVAALAGNPRFLEAQLRHQSADENIAVTAASLAPDLTLSFSLSSTNTDYATQDSASTENANVRLGLSVPLTEGVRNISQFKIEQSRVRELDYATQSLLRSIEADARGFWYKFMAAKSALTFAQQRTDLARAALVGVSEARRIGAKSVQEELSAMDEVTEARISYASAKFQSVVNGHQLLALTGNISSAYSLDSTVSVR